MSFQIKHGLFKFNLTDYHAVLGVPIDADNKQIRQRYLKIVYRLHPDTCKAETNEKEKASELLSKLVNPAYEHLSKQQSHLEYQVVLTQIGQRLAKGENITVASEAAKKLYQADKNLETTYRDLLKALAAEQYKALAHVNNQTAQISELNLVYLMLKHKASQQKERSPQTALKSTAAKTARPSAQANGKPEKKKPESPIATHVRRAQESLEREQFSQAVLDLRDALKLDPNHSTCHGLIGLAYLKQNQLGMAKVHINKALQSNSQDPAVIQAKQELDKLFATATNSKTTRPTGEKTTEPRGGIFGGLFGGKKK